MRRGTLTYRLMTTVMMVLCAGTVFAKSVEEKRTEIATLKALGYSNGSIILKYVI